MQNLFIYTALVSCLSMGGAFFSLQAKSSISQGSSICTDVARNDTNKEKNVLCIDGLITPKIANEIVKYPFRISRIVVNSDGGDAESAMSIGRRIFQDRAVLEVEEKCISSCANYLIPASRYVDLKDDSFIVMHGNIPRGMVEYGQKVSGRNGFTHESVKKALEEFPKIRNGILKKENAYFDEILIDDAYITRYVEQIRDITIKSSVRCKKYHQFLLILDETYLRAFGIKVNRWPSLSSQETLAAASKKFADANVVVGFFGDKSRLLSPLGVNCRPIDHAVTEENPVIFE